MSELTALRSYDGINGGRRIFWYEFRTVISQLINRYDIPPIDRDFLPQWGARAVAGFEASWPEGGIRGPHFHYGNQIYPVNVQQWNELASKVLDRCAASLRVAETVMDHASLELDTVMTLGEASTVFLPMEGHEFIKQG